MGEFLGICSRVLWFRKYGSVGFPAYVIRDSKGAIRILKTHFAPELDGWNPPEPELYRWNEVSPRPSWGMDGNHVLVRSIFRRIDDLP